MALIAHCTYQQKGLVNLRDLTVEDLLQRNATLVMERAEAEAKVTKLKNAINIFKELFSIDFTEHYENGNVIISIYSKDERFDNCGEASNICSKVNAKALGEALDE